MKKIPCLFEREFISSREIKLLDTVTPGCEWVLNGEGIASRKLDGTAVAIIDGKNAIKDTIRRKENLLRKMAFLVKSQIQ